jgi:oligopeptide transport system substrate-binding protein
MWKETLNLDITLANQEWKVFLDTQDNFDFDVSRASWIGDYVDPMTFLGLGLSTNGSNTAGFSDPVYDRMLLESVPAATTHEERLERFYEAETYLMEQMPFIPIYTYMQKYLLDPSVKGMPANIRQEYNFRYVSLEAQ